MSKYTIRIKNTLKNKECWVKDLSPHSIYHVFTDKSADAIKLDWDTAVRVANEVGEQFVLEKLASGFDIENDILIIVNSDHAAKWMGINFKDLLYRMVRSGKYQLVN